MGDIEIYQEICARSLTPVEDGLDFQIRLRESLYKACANSFHRELVPSFKCPSRQLIYKSATLKAVENRDHKPTDITRTPWTR